MNNVIVRSSLFAIAAALVSSFAVAGPTSELKVTGVIKPVACTPTIGAGNAIIDYGNITRAQLTRGGYTKLTTQEVDFSINCDGAVKMAVKATDNRASSKLNGLASQVSATAGENAMFGLGAAGTTQVGAFHFSMKQGSFNGKNAGGTNETLDTIGSTDKVSWTKTTSGGMSTDRVLSWAPTSSTTPGAYSSVTGKLSVVAVINKPEELPATQDINLDGSATIEVIYL